MNHLPVMPIEALRDLALKPGMIAVDTTAGCGGHLALIAQCVGPNGRVIALDQDPHAHQVDAAGGVAQTYTQVQLFHAPFSQIKQILGSQGIPQVDGILCDLGVSSPQLDDSARGFSFSKDGPLDMRMDTSAHLTAYGLIGQVSEVELANIIFEFGEERFSRRIARAIKQRWPLPNSTLALADLIASVCGRKGRIHPATRTFQALRIAVNRELDQLDLLLESLESILAPKGRAVFISFHSLEDRRVKQAFKKGTHWRILHKKPVLATEEEIKKNPRARSAKLRSVEMLGGQNASS